MINFKKLYSLTIIALGLTTQPIQAATPEKTELSISVGSQILNYLPLSLTVSLGHFKEQGLNVRTENFQAGGSKALQALVAGSTDAVVGFYDHTISMQSKGKDIVSVVLLNDMPGIVLAARNEAGLKKGSDLKGHTVGITAPGSSSDMIARYYVKRNGLSQKDVSFIAVGSGAPGMAALERKEVDSLVNFDPVATLLQQRSTTHFLFDTRTAAGSKALFDGNYPTACLYVTRQFMRRHPETVQRLVNAFVKTLKWIYRNTAETIADKTPKEAITGDKGSFIRALKGSKAIFSSNGMMQPQDALTVQKVLSDYDENVARAKIDLSKTFTNQFVAKAK
ncbi:ABC transporter substrate-binding protein [Chromobacterium sp. S0633]|uniref:ABC transporter substrate-binding protein n=1 Tax=Chromobacterium sp. S0633 TaxID=2957805 RepID=UPI00209D8398|nr:ABC transporter substrate-binding protein [Chromobacterium sp. S0633]MCP1289679.1 ABC transporter substrate-binding protein [Chromobacterium sp. S0633]